MEAVLEMTIEPLMNALKAMSPEVLSVMLDTLPIEFSVVDADDNVLFWNQHGTRIFKRGPGVIGRNVRICHPKGSIDKVEKVVKYLKSGKGDEVAFWIDLPDGETTRKILIRYFAMRDRGQVPRHARSIIEPNPPSEDQRREQISRF